MGGEITPTLKNIRAASPPEYRARIESMYSADKRDDKKKPHA